MIFTPDSQALSLLREVHQIVQEARARARVEAPPDVAAMSVKHQAVKRRIDKFEKEAEARVRSLWLRHSGSD